MKIVILVLLALFLVSIIGNVYLYSMYSQEKELQNYFGKRTFDLTAEVSSMSTLLNKEANTEKCIKKAEEDAMNRRNGTCKINGKEDGCGLNENQAKFYRDGFEKDRDFCLERYK